ncbi:MAG: DUF3644 domain-containing protein [Clostridia bacterium]|nr:DUF3644 domain-containing protein [Clostridia bacterium]
MGRISNTTKLSVKLRQKSIEAFMLCLELYNKPTINYRIESSSYLLCNAWELLLKSHYIMKNGEKSIYRETDNKTFSLEQMLMKYYDPNSPIRKNLEYIIEKIRNKATHLIVREHDLLYTPLLQMAVLNYVDELKDKFNIDISDSIPLESLALIVKKAEKPQNIAKMYGKSFTSLYKKDEKDLTAFIQTNSKNDDACSVVAIVETHLAFVKDPKKADIKAHYDSGGTALQKIIISKDIDNSHPYAMTKVIKIVKELFQNKNINLKGLHNNSLNLYNKRNKITTKPEYYAQVEYGKTIIKKYSQRYIDKLVEDITQHNDLFAK